MFRHTGRESACTYRPVCTRPENTDGYVIGIASNGFTEFNLDLSTGHQTSAGASFSVAVSCATNYEGTAVATPCTESGPYTLSGCEPIVCTTPADTTGYVVVSETMKDLSGGDGSGSGLAPGELFAVEVGCDFGYQNGVQAAGDASGANSPATAVACTTSGEYTLTGCVETFVPGHDHVAHGRHNKS